VNKKFFAYGMLVLATIFWGISFPIIKAILYLQADQDPTWGTWFLSSLTLSYRFLIAAVILLVVTRFQYVRKLRWLDIEQGLGVGFFCGLGMYFQADGLNYTNASTSAFLTQTYAVFLPLIAALRFRKKPKPSLWISLGFVVSGVALLSNFDWQTFRLGRGELETIVGSLLFMGQILWLERPRYRSNDLSATSFWMFVVIAVLMGIVAIVSAPDPSALVLAYSQSSTVWLLVALTLFSTLGAFWLMNTYQPVISSAEAGIVYCFESVAASIFALFLPGVFSKAFGLNYPNETLTNSLMIGGVLILTGHLILAASQLSKKRAGRT
jgi:drug/metabolite transporter (DMT)-like permease